jgi:hypothetical protein
MGALRMAERPIDTLRSDFNLLFGLFLAVSGPPGAGLQNLAEDVTLQDTNPSYLTNLRANSHFWVLDFNAQIRILIFEWSMRRSDG